MHVARGEPAGGSGCPGQPLDPGEVRWPRWSGVRAFVVGLAGVWLLAGVGRVPAAEPSLVVIPVCTVRGPQEVDLELILLAGGQGVTGEARLRVEFADPAPAGARFEGAAPRPRTLVLPVAAADWQVGQLAVVFLGGLVLDRAVPPVLQVRGGLEGEPPALLGTLERAGEGDPGQLPRCVRAWPGNGLPAGRSPVWVAAVLVPAAEAGAFLVRLVFANCGAAFAADCDAFVHLETEPTGEHLDRTIALGLYPMSAATDSASWSAAELTVVDLGSFSLPATVPEVLYLRAGLFDHRGGAGSGKRLPLAGPDETDRALVGRLITRAGSTRFERTFAAGEASP